MITLSIAFAARSYWRVERSSGDTDMAGLRIGFRGILSFSARSACQQARFRPYLLQKNNLRDCAFEGTGIPASKEAMCRF